MTHVAPLALLALVLASTSATTLPLYQDGAAPIAAIRHLEA